jgi:hypothetical protein
LHSYDYLNVVPFYLNNSVSRRVDMPGVEVLDEVGVPLLIDAYPYDERFQGFQLYQRGVRWTTLERGLKDNFALSPRELIDEWTIGFEASNIVLGQLERELIQNLNDPRIRYLDYYAAEFDHAAHHNRDRATHLLALQNLDALVGRIWTAIQESPLASETVFVLVSDHGINSDERVYSQGYNLVKLLCSRAGGGHYVVTKRRLLNDYSIKGIYPLIPLITTTTPDTFYLKNQSTDYPTALLDFDGNERAAIHLRDSDLNVLHILLQQLQRRDISAALRRALTESFFTTLDQRRLEWKKNLANLNTELGAVRRHIEKQRVIVNAQRKKWSKADQDAGRDKDSRRIYAELDSLIADERNYAEYARTLGNLLALQRNNFAASQGKIEDVIQKRAMGERNSINELQNYVIGIAPNGFTLRDDGSLDMQRSFARIDYFALLHETSVRNNVQAKISSHSVDFVAASVAPDLLRGLIEDDTRTLTATIGLYAGLDRQALVLVREDERGQTSLRYVPIKNLTQQANGALRFARIEWRANLPLKLWEDTELQVPEGIERNTWLSNWHTDLEWLRAAHRTQYSNGIVGLGEHFVKHQTSALNLNDAQLTLDEKLLRAFRLRQRDLVTTDLLVLANDHWNFDVRGFNPGDNHGSFLRVSTHSTLMFAGGERTGIPRGATIEEPYDGLSFVPTVLAITGALRDVDSRTLVPVLWQRGFRQFPGRVIKELLPRAAQDNAVPLAETQ